MCKTFILHMVVTVREKKSGFLYSDLILLFHGVNKYICMHEKFSSCKISFEYNPGNFERNKPRLPAKKSQLGENCGNFRVIIYSMFVVNSKFYIHLVRSSQCLNI